MQKHDDYIAGPHRYWIHFWCGLAFGAMVGGWISWRLFAHWGCVLLVTGGISIVTAYCSGRWGEAAWEWIIKRLPWIG